MNPYLAGLFLVGLVIVQSTVMPHAMIANTPPLACSSSIAQNKTGISRVAGCSFSARRIAQP